MMRRFALLCLLWFVFPVSSGAEGAWKGTAVLSMAEEADWWVGLSAAQQERLVKLFRSSWFDNLSEKEKIAYCRVAHTLYEFLGSGVDSNPDDSYIGFAPLLLRTSFHSSGTYHAASGSGGSNGGTIFNQVELDDDENACINNATDHLNSLLNGSAIVSLADALVIGGVVALDTMKFPRMDLLRLQGGRVDLERLAVRQSLPSPDHDPMDHMVSRYNLSVSELVAVIGGAHNFGAAHGRCSGYIGQWTSDPLSWSDSNTGKPEYFVDLVRNDWRWYKICTFMNGTASYESIPDPFADGLPSPEPDIIPPFTCGTEKSEVAIVCEEQAMRGCDFDDGLYNISASPCNIAVLQMRVRAEFFMKANPKMRPYVETFADNADLLAEEFAAAFMKLTHNGLERCGLNGHGCGANAECVQYADTETGRYLSSRCVYYSAPTGGEGESYMATKGGGVSNDSWSLGHGGSIAVLVLWFITGIVLVWVAYKPVRQGISEGESASKNDTTVHTPDLS